MRQWQKLWKCPLKEPESTSPLGSSFSVVHVEETVYKNPSKSSGGALLFSKLATQITGMRVGVCGNGWAETHRARQIPQTLLSEQPFGTWRPSPQPWGILLSLSPLSLQLRHTGTPPPVCWLQICLESPTPVTGAALLLERSRHCPRAQPPFCVLVHKNSTLSSLPWTSTVCVYVVHSSSTRSRKVNKRGIQPVM